MAISTTALGELRLLRSGESPTDRPSSFQTILELACETIDAIRDPSFDRDRRGSQRSAVALRAQCRGKWGISDCLITELSPGGMGLVSGQAQEVGEELTVAWRFDSGSPTLRIVCSVKHVSLRQVGVELSTLDDAERRHILDFLQARQVGPD